LAASEGRTEADLGLLLLVVEVVVVEEEVSSWWCGVWSCGWWLLVWMERDPALHQPLLLLMLPCLAILYMGWPPVVCLALASLLNLLLLLLMPLLLLLLISLLLLLLAVRPQWSQDACWERL
jgi:hypothetical protein